MTLMTVFKAKHEKLQVKVRAARGKLWREYRGILERHDKPRDGDADRLVELLGELSLTDQHVELHLVVLAELAEIQPLADAEEAARAEIVAADAEIEKQGYIRGTAQHVEEETEKLKAQALSKYTGSLEAKDKIARLAREFPGLLKGDDSLQPELPTGFAGRAGTRVNDARKRLGV